MTDNTDIFDLLDPHDLNEERIIRCIEEHPLCVLEKSQDKQCPPLYHAAELASSGSNDITSIVNAILKHNPEVDFKDMHGRTPLWIAASKGGTEIVNILLENKASPLIECCTCKISVLHIAVQKRHLEVARLLLEHGVFVDPQDAKGETPLFKAVRNNDLEMIKELIKWNASKSVQNKDGRTPVSLVTGVGDEVYVDPRVEAEITGKAVIIPDQKGGEEEDTDDYNNDPYLQKFLDHIEERGLEAFFTRGGADLKEVLRPCTVQARALIKELRAEKEESASEVALLTLYDLAILIDDSSSMQFEDQGSRIQVLQDFLRTISHISSFTRNGTNGTIRRIRFLNGRFGGDYVDRAGVEKLLRKHSYTGMTRIGSELRKKILTEDLINQTMPRPLLVMVITDGNVQGEKKNVLYDTLSDVYKFCREIPTGEYSVSFKFCRIGDDQGAKEMLQALDDHEELGKHIDCQRAHVNLESILNKTHSFHEITKLLIGAISSEWDEDTSDADDEKPSIPNSPALRT